MAHHNVEPINLHDRASSVTGHWQPQHIHNINDTHSMKLATIQGEFFWHSHPNTDELFYCVSGGPFSIEINRTARTPREAEQLGCDHVAQLRVGDVFCVARGVQHRPVAPLETGIMMIEKIGTVNIGDREGDERTVYVEEK
ncbi:hypothetical protein LTR37_015075 [Vermiconidia calcicola]|uniref:Uncharacterized protein n=1 Tax=Vermiconidia calcicola TaxID=1690605 RepID=A0ACC3MSE2_9PEZI|nr:hypothetical protein LTR37_015075 [Vermiconidia calcicola]